MLPKAEEESHAMGSKRKKVIGLVGLAAVMLAVALAAAALLSRERARAAAQSCCGSPAPPATEPQPTSPVQILSVTPESFVPPAGLKASAAAKFRAYNIVVKNATTEDVEFYVLQCGFASGPLKGKAFKSTAMYATGPGQPALAAGETKSQVLDVFFGTGAEELAIQVDVVALADGKVWGKNDSGAFRRFVDYLITQRGVDLDILTMLQTQGPSATESYLKERLAYLEPAVTKFTSPEWIQ